MNNKSHELLEDLIYIGEIIKPHGVKGYLKFFLYNEKSDILLDNQVIYLESKVNKLKLEIEDINFVSSIPLIKFIDIDNREEAGKYRKFKIALPKNNFKQDDESLYLFNFIGCDFYFDEEHIGIVKDVVAFSSNDLLLVQSKDGKEHYVPINKELIKFFDIEDQKLVMSKIEGLLDIC